MLELAYKMINIIKIEGVGGERGKIGDSLRIIPGSSKGRCRLR